jgi:hypothetical protein
MKATKYLLGALVLMQIFAGGVFAEKVIFVHGMSLINSNESCQDQTECSEYWDEIPQGIDHVFVGYDGRRNPFASAPTAGSVRLLEMLNRYCRADQGQSCRIVAESLGGFTTAGTIAMYNQSGLYNILYSTQIVSAEGGSEIANLGDTAIEILKFVFGLGDNQIAAAIEQSRDAIDALVTSSARGLFDHNQNNDTIFYHVAARKSIWIAEPFLPGEDDTLVAFHSSCAYRTTGAFNVCMGQKIRPCSWCFWQRKQLITPFDAHEMHPAVPNDGVDLQHSGVHNIIEYHTL